MTLVPAHLPHPRAAHAPRAMAVSGHVAACPRSAALRERNGPGTHGGCGSGSPPRERGTPSLWSLSRPSEAYPQRAPPPANGGSGVTSRDSVFLPSQAAEHSSGLCVVFLRASGGERRFPGNERCVPAQAAWSCARACARCGESRREQPRRYPGARLPVPQRYPGFPAALRPL